MPPTDQEVLPYLTTTTTVYVYLWCKVVFLTALFYLLASSSHSYKPVELFTSISPTSDEMAFGNAFEEAIG